MYECVTPINTKPTARPYVRKDFTQGYADGVFKKKCTTVLTYSLNMIIVLIVLFKNI